ncbi:ribosomal protein P0-like [Acrasis kona]|uniref:Ribosomal protein P0-like n=1 Tax=Acrasis kona TaxID=1008807 RepID=A0AAW2Z8P5_9EUKA
MIPRNKLFSIYTSKISLCLDTFKHVYVIHHDDLFDKNRLKGLLQHIPHHLDGSKRSLMNAAIKDYAVRKNKNMSALISAIQGDVVLLFTNENFETVQNMLKSDKIDLAKTNSIHEGAPVIITSNLSFERYSKIAPYFLTRGIKVSHRGYARSNLEDPHTLLQHGDIVTKEKLEVLNYFKLKTRRPKTKIVNFWSEGELYNIPSDDYIQCIVDEALLNVKIIQFVVPCHDCFVEFNNDESDTDSTESDYTSSSDSDGPFIDDLFS